MITAEFRSLHTYLCVRNHNLDDPPSGVEGYFVAQITGVGRFGGRVRYVCDIRWVAHSGSVISTFFFDDEIIGVEIASPFSG